MDGPIRDRKKSASSIQNHISPLIVKMFKDRWWGGRRTLQPGVWSLRPAQRRAADERTERKAGNRAVHWVHEEMDSFVRTQGLAVTTQGPISSVWSSLGHIHNAQTQISHYESEKALKKNKKKHPHSKSKGWAGFSRAGTDVQRLWIQWHFRFSDYGTELSYRSHL